MASDKTDADSSRWSEWMTNTFSKSETQPRHGVFLNEDAKVIDADATIEKPSGKPVEDTKKTLDLSDDAPDAAKAKIMADNNAAKTKAMADDAAKGKKTEQGLDENKLKEMMDSYKKKEEQKISDKMTVERLEENDGTRDKGGY